MTRPSLALLRIAVPLAAATLLLGACATDRLPDMNVVLRPYSSQFSVPLSGAAQVPPVETPGTGRIEVNLNPDTLLLSWTIQYGGLGGPVTAAHFHGPAMPGENAPVVLGFRGPLGSPIQGTRILTPEQAADFRAGKWYVNLHTAGNPGGELRAQIPARP